MAADGENSQMLRYITIGAGNRGNVYAWYALENPERAQVVGVVEPSEYRRRTFLQKFQKLNTIPEDNIFTDWRQLVQREKFADAVVITTPDNQHAEAAIALANKGYHILVEKPLAVTEQDCINITSAAKQNNVILAVCHVMRYTPYTQKIKELIDSGVLGDVVNVHHLEPVGHWHFAHSYVRGNWRKESDSTFSLMAKSCHDIDWLRYIMGVPCQRVSSFGSLRHFRKESKPKEAGNATRCLDCNVSDSCPYSATKVYLDAVKSGVTTWPVHVICSSEPDIESVTDALRTGPYGQCVYESDNEVVDNQVVNMEFEGGKTVAFSMVAFTQELCVRQTRIHGTHGQLVCDGTNIVHSDFRGKGSETTYTPKVEKDTRMSGHGYADWYLMDSFVQAVLLNDPSKIISGPEETLESHLIVFAAEKARRERTVVDTSRAVATAIGASK